MIVSNIRYILMAVLFTTAGFIKAQDTSKSVGTSEGSLTVSDMGAAVYSLKFEVPDGGPLTPEIGLTYNSQAAGYGLAGYGFNITGISCITRGGKDLFHDGTLQGVTYTDDDTYFLDGQRLILKPETVCADSAVYTVEGNPYIRVTEHIEIHEPDTAGFFGPDTTGQFGHTLLENDHEGTAATQGLTAWGDVWFEVRDNQGNVCQYGNSNNSKISLSGRSLTPCIASWYISSMEDRHANYMTYEYDTSKYCAKPVRIIYGKNRLHPRSLSNIITFGYQSLGDNSRTKLIRDKKSVIDVCLSEVRVTSNGQNYRKYYLNYDEGTTDLTPRKWTRLTSVTEENGQGEQKNPVVFNWECLPSLDIEASQIDVQTDNSNRTVTETEKSFYAADLNGDGISDIIKVSHVRVIGFGDGKARYWTYYYIYPSRIIASGNTNHISHSANPIVHMVDGSYSFMETCSIVNCVPALDFDGDGYNDLIITQYFKDHSESREFFRVIYGSDIANNTYGWYRPYSLLPPVPQSYSVDLQSNDSAPLFACFDSDGDGKDDVICLETDKKDGLYSGFIMKYLDRTHGTVQDITRFSVSLNKKPKRLFSGDYNNDGLIDLIVLHNSGYKIFFNQGGDPSSPRFSNTNAETGTSIKNYWRIEQGDFNGDNFPDFLYAVEGDSCLNIVFNKGNGNFSCNQVCPLDFGCKNAFYENQKFSLQVWDADNDGKTDVMASKAFYTYVEDSISLRFDSIKTMWLQSVDNTLQFCGSYTKHRESDVYERHIFLGDFDGDGQVELANYGSCLNSTDDTFEEGKINIYKSGGNLSQVGKITSITDGMGNIADISYSYLTDPNVYTNTYSGTYPANTYTVPILVVSNIEADNGCLSRQTTSYKYKDLKIHIGGKGILGFGSVMKENTALEVKDTISIAEWNTTRWLPTKVLASNAVGTSYSKVTSTHIIADIDSTNYFTYVSKKEIIDSDGNKSIDSTQYDTEKGVILCETVTNVGTDMYKRVEYTYPDNPNEAGIWLPSTQTATQKHPDDPAPYTRITAYTYDSIGNMLTQTVNAGTDLALTTTHTYDVYGNVLSSVSTGNGVKPVISRNSYDTDGLHVVRTYTEPASTEYEYTYDRFGRVLTETDKTNAARPLVTTHTYDGWGRRTSTLTPDSLLTTYSIGWTSAGNSRYYTSETCAGQPPVTTWYDKSGRELESLTKGPKNTDIRKTTAYNSKGQVGSITSQTGTLTLSQSYTYDEKGRVTEESFSSGKTVHHTYGNRSETVTVGDRSHTTETDAWGNVIRTTDPSGSVEYTYSSAGLPVRVSSHGTEVTMTYDAAGNRTSLTDPDAGTMTYSYAADGTLLTQTDGRNINTVNTYDDLGRLAKTVTGSQEITYQYGTEGNAAMRLTGKSLNGNTISYTYDRLGRITGEQRVTRGQTVYTCGYIYNSLGQLSRQIYNSYIYVDYEYDTCGYRNQTVANGYVLYRRVQYSGYTDSFSHGQLLTTYCRNNKGYETERRITKGYTTLAQFQMTHDVNTDNLLTRRRDSNLQESFTYDNLDRLLSVSTGGTPNMQMTYQPNGNIIRKTNVGIYTYNTDGKPHAVRRVDSLSVVPVSSLLRTEFNDLGKIQRITYDATRRQMEFEYGPDRERWYSVLTDSTGTVPIVRTTYYAGDYEKVTEDSTTTEFYYLDGNAILVKRGDTLTPYLAFTDNLGSILSILDRSGESVYEATYDVWGQQEVTLNEIGFHRGYTGHEMLPEFGIINMNGRLYDPMLGRFLSPDNYVQTPTNSQNFNRYSYCLNNPLKYNDPSGNIFGLDDAFFAFAMFGIGTSMMQAAAFDQNIWKAGAISAMCSFGTYGIGSACSAIADAGMKTAGVLLIQAGAHGLNSGLVSALNGDNFGQGFLTGVMSSWVGSQALNSGMSKDLMLAYSSLSGGVSSWALGGSFWDGVRRGMEIGIYNELEHLKTIQLPEVECVYKKSNRIIWPTITKIVYNAVMGNRCYSEGTFSMYSNYDLVYRCPAVSGAKQKYTIPSGVYHVNRIWDRTGDGRFTRNGVGFTASLQEDPFIDSYTKIKREYIRIHPCRDNYTLGCIGLKWDDKNGLKICQDMIQQTLQLECVSTIPLEVHIIGR